MPVTYKGVIVGSVDKLNQLVLNDTPSAAVVKMLMSEGHILGVSSRGRGEIVDNKVIRNDETEWSLITRGDMEIEEKARYLDEVIIPKYKKEQRKVSSGIASGILAIRPDVGIYIKVENIAVAKIAFPEEFKLISDAYFQILKKLNNER